MSEYVKLEHKLVGARVGGCVSTASDRAHPTAKRMLRIAGLGLYATKHMPLKVTVA
jgi:hypothetical protein